MQYTEGYLAFLDILGFSQFVSKEENGEKTADLFNFVRNFCYLFNSSKKLKCNVAFFSDSIVITSQDLEEMLAAIVLAEMHLKNAMGLLYRGGICYGKYYHNNGVTFGPAVIKAYGLENKANYSRIIFDKNLDLKEWDNSLLIFKDVDGYYCVNPFLLAVNEQTKYGGEKPEYPEEKADEVLMGILKKHREDTLARIEEYRGNPVVDKYLWRVRAFNYTCESIADHLDKIDLLVDNGIAPSEGLKQNLLSLRISFM